MLAGLWPGLGRPGGRLALEVARPGGRLACFHCFFSFVLRRLLAIFLTSLEIFIGVIRSTIAEHTQGIGMK